VVVRPATGMAPECPGHGVQQGRLASAVRAAQAGQGQSFKRYRGWVTIGEEIPQFQPHWQHQAVSLARISLEYSSGSGSARTRKDGNSVASVGRSGGCHWRQENLLLATSSALTGTGYDRYTI